MDRSPFSTVNHQAQRINFIVALLGRSMFVLLFIPPPYRLEDQERGGGFSKLEKR